MTAAIHHVTKLDLDLDGLGDWGSQNWTISGVMEHVMLVPQHLPPSSTRTFLDFRHIDMAHKAATPVPTPRLDDQPSIKALAMLGIKVWDFAYESVLPPIAPLFAAPPPVRRQIQPGPSTLQAVVAGPSRGQAAHLHSRRALKRTRPDDTEEEDVRHGFVMGVARQWPDEEGRTRPRKLQRMQTEVLLPERLQVSLPLQRENALLSLDDEVTLRAAVYDVFRGYQPPNSQLQSYPESRSQEYWQGYQQSQGYALGSSRGNLRGTEPLIATPSVTPNGSLQWIHDPPPPVLTEAPVSPLPRSASVDCTCTPDCTPPNTARLACTNASTNQRLHTFSMWNDEGCQKGPVKSDRASAP
ncbi:hypothetical protein B0H19DRAFT_1084893 [Mycena capillaripes]|nr:hypothetical protein B0H19DRAFT_1084893 [Mycena capillaripes]